MSTTTKWVTAIVGVIAVVGIAAAMGILTIIPTDTTVTPGTDPQTPPALADGDYFAFVTVGEEDGVRVIGVDVAEFLTGDAARQAAIDAGVIGPDEDLPNDYFIANPESAFELIEIDPNAVITLIPADNTSGEVMINVDVFEQVYDGTYTGTPIYGVVAGQPIPMDVVIDGGLVTGLDAVYLP